MGAEALRYFSRRLEMAFRVEAMFPVPRRPVAYLGCGGWGVSVRCVFVG